MANMDEIIRQMELDDLADAAELAKMSVREYAKLKGMEPQLVYYYIRTGRIKVETCICGRTVIDVASANKFFQEKEAKKNGALPLPEG